MASIKKKSSGGGGANWMDTYGDMVTLLLCFFVLLYSISSIDQEKWLLVVRSFNKDALVPEPDPVGPAGENNEDSGDGFPALAEVEEDLTELYEFLEQYVAASSENGDIMVTRGDGYVFISFADSVFFDGNSSVLRPDGKQMLNGIIPALEQCGPSIAELRVLGHTAKLSPNRDNEATIDWSLSSGRAAAVVAHIQDNSNHDLLNPGRMIPEGRGQWRPVSDNDTAEGMARNRRVEIIITGQGIDGVLGDSYQRYETMYKSTGTLETSN